MSCVSVLCGAMGDVSVESAMLRRGWSRGCGGTGADMDMMSVGYNECERGDTKKLHVRHVAVDLNGSEIHRGTRIEE